MCLISFYPANVMPTEWRLQNGTEVNPDGHGFAIVTGRPGAQRLITHRGMDAKEMIARFMEARAANMDGPAMFHSRIATSGLVDVTGCHPFKVGSDNRTVVAHNGILFSPGPKSLRSDSAIFAEAMLPRFGSLDSTRKRAKLEKFIGDYNKLVILTVNPQRRSNAYVINEKAGIWIQGEWHSNDSYEGKWWDRAPSVADTEPWPCDICGMRYSVDMDTMICDACYSCNDCHMHIDSCMCFYGRQSTPKSAEESARVFEREAIHGTTTYEWAGHTEGFRKVSSLALDSKVTTVGTNS